MRSRREASLLSRPLSVGTEQQLVIDELASRLNTKAAEVAHLTERLHLQHVQHERQYALLYEQLHNQPPSSPLPSSTSSPLENPSATKPTLDPSPGAAAPSSTPSLLPPINAALPAPPFEGDVGLSPEWAGLSNPCCRGKSSYALLQNRDGRFTVLNKASHFS